LNWTIDHYFYITEASKCGLYYRNYFDDIIICEDKRYKQLLNYKDKQTIDKNNIYRYLKHKCKHMFYPNSCISCPQLALGQDVSVTKNNEFLNPSER